MVSLRSSAVAVTIMVATVAAGSVPRPSLRELASSTAASVVHAATGATSAGTSVASVATGTTSAGTSVASAATGATSSTTSVASAATGATSAGSSIASASAGVTSAGTSVASDATGATSSATSVASARATFPPTSLPIVVATFCGVDLIGGDVSNAKSPDAQSCVQMCRSSGDAATWTNHEGGTCWCKHFGGSAPWGVPKVGAVSFIRSSNGAGTTFGPMAIADMPGNDIANVPGATALDCNSSCRSNRRCFAHTWTNLNGGTCWLKSKASPYVYKTGALSTLYGNIFAQPRDCV